MKYNARLRILEASTYNIQHLSIQKFRPSPPRGSLRVDSVPPLAPGITGFVESIQDTTQQSKQQNVELRNYALLN